MQRGFAHAIEARSTKGGRDTEDSLLEPSRHDGTGEGYGSGRRVAPTAGLPGDLSALNGDENNRVAL
jgi:hypothetical protein